MQSGTPTDTQAMDARVGASLALSQSPIMWVLAHRFTPESSMPRESSPLPSRACFGRDELIEKLRRVFGGFAEFRPLVYSCQSMGVVRW